MRKVILASESPRRRELLSQADINYVACASNIKEEIHLENGLENALMQVAFDKANDVLKKYPHDTIIGADTIVVVDDKILGKPKNDEEAKQMLQLLSGRNHRVLTGVAIISEHFDERFYEESKVTFYDLEEELIDTYVKSKESRDKAGAYGIQGKGSILVKEIEGDYYNIVGLPIAKLYRKLKELQ